MVMGGDSCSKGREFESWHCILNGHFPTFICCKNCNVCLKRQKQMKKRPRLVEESDDVKPAFGLLLLNKSCRVAAASRQTMQMSKIYEHGHMRSGRQMTDGLGEIDRRTDSKEKVRYIGR